MLAECWCLDTYKHIFHVLTTFFTTPIGYYDFLQTLVSGPQGPDIANNHYREGTALKWIKYFSVLYKGEFFINFFILFYFIFLLFLFSCLPLSFHQWVQNRLFSFEVKALIWIRHHCKTRFYKLPAAIFRPENLKFYKNSEKYRKTMKDIQHVTKFQTCWKIKCKYLFLKFHYLMEIMEN